jgi:hypothetical protein
MVCYPLELCDNVPDLHLLQKKDLIAVWTRQPEIAELANFNQLILTIVANQAGCK